MGARSTISVSARPIICTMLIADWPWRVHDAICEKPLVISPWNLDQLEQIEEEYGGQDLPRFCSFGFILRLSGFEQSCLSVRRPNRWNATSFTRPAVGLGITKAGRGAKRVPAVWR